MNYLNAFLKSFLATSVFFLVSFYGIAIGNGFINSSKITTTHEIFHFPSALYLTPLELYNVYKNNKSLSLPIVAKQNKNIIGSVRKEISLTEFTKPVFFWLFFFWLVFIFKDPKKSKNNTSTQTIRLKKHAAKLKQYKSKTSLALSWETFAQSLVIQSIALFTVLLVISRLFTPSIDQNSTSLGYSTLGLIFFGIVAFMFYLYKKKSKTLDQPTRMKLVLLMVAATMFIDLLFWTLNETYKTARISDFIYIYILIFPVLGGLSFFLSASLAETFWAKVKKL